MELGSIDHTEKEVLQLKFYVPYRHNYFPVVPDFNGIDDMIPQGRQGDRYRWQSLARIPVQRLAAQSVSRGW